jgi:hypothetical protein
MLRKASYVTLIGLFIAFAGYLTLVRRFPVGPVVFVLGFVPIVALIMAKRPLKRAIPDLIFGAIDTGLLTIPALIGGLFYGVAGAITGGIIGDALTDGIAGFFEGSISTWLREKGINESRAPITTSLGKMAGCLLGSGLVLSIFLLFGVRPIFA